MTLSLQSRRNFGKRVLSILWPPSLILMAGEKKKFVPRGRSMVRSKERGEGGGV